MLEAAALNMAGEEECRKEVRKRYLDSLDHKARERLSSRLAPSSRKKLKTAMRHLKRLKRKLRGVRDLFRVPRSAGDLKVLLHNEWSLVIFAEFLATRRNPRTRKLIAVDTIAEYVSMVKTELSVQYGFAIAGDPQRLPQLVKAMRRERPRLQRRRRRGIRGRHLRKAWTADARLRRETADSANAWAAMTSAWQALARGGEVATPREQLKLWCKSSRPTRADLTFHRDRSRRYAKLMLRPIKRTDGELGEKVPILIEEGDGGGDDTYAALARMVELDPCPAHEEKSTPLFRIGGKPMTVERLRAYAKYVWKAAKQRGNVGAHSFRIGGATDLADQGASMALLQAKGRWASDIAKIYARMTKRAQLAASRAMQRRSGRDMEELFPSFTQGR